MMNPRELRQISLEYSFPFKFFEVLQFGAKNNFDAVHTFADVFHKVKQLHLFAASRLYLKAAMNPGHERDQFADYLVNVLEHTDYKQVDFKELIEDYKYPAARYDNGEWPAYWKTTPRFIEPKEMHANIQAVLRLHISEDAAIYRFENPQQTEKIGLARIWEDFQHHICIDRKQNIIQLVTSGFD